MKHRWYVIAVSKLEFPRKSHKEFQIISKSLRGAVMKAENKICKELDGWKIKSIWWINPENVRKE